MPGHLFGPLKLELALALALALGTLPLGQLFRLYKRYKLSTRASDDINESSNLGEMFNYTTNNNSEKNNERDKDRERKEIAIGSNRQQAAAGQRG